ncbi:hypothetical protein [Anabaena sp. UHCC 0399]|uniref:hypothetical protein n=1 Tax=Anabaena sp. UHCC 0399 TaxID=3110238 RepID=UPI002B21AFE5|nr:hypothetical protein [Anabaena sp. UHCC 0399]MEA5567242.1 hypothetical protein [Anabaena sp. UHCC 0399]
MLQQMALSDLIVDLSTNEQQLLAGGQFFDDEGGDEETPISSTGKDGLDSAGVGTTRVYRISSTGLVRVRRVR